MRKSKWLGTLLLSWSCVAGYAADPAPAGADAVERKARAHWAFQPLKRPETPPGQDPIDSFVEAGLRARELTHAPPASSRDLIRRVYFDLIGLPPAMEEITAFENDVAPDRFAKLVDRLLALPQYGERWGRHWLDVVRYTESSGFEYDRLRENAWPYRDHVIKSFNDDKPYDRFLREQIAGDVLEPITRDGIIGTSLLVCGAYDQAGNSQANATQRAVTREEEMEDLLSVVGQTFLGLTLNCARCHDHKFDPIPQLDYYRVKSVFDGVKHGERPIESPSETRRREERRAEAQRKLAAEDALVARIEAGGWQAAAAKRPAGPKQPAPPAFARWTFDGEPNPVMPGDPRDGAHLTAGRLVLPREGAHFETVPLPRDIREKTLETWVALADLVQGGGAAISLETLDGSAFDAIVFAERQARKWVAGSEGFGRTRDLEAPVETAPAGEFVHLAIVYRADNSIAVYRNGLPYGAPYTPGAPLRTFRAGEAHVVLGRRHRGGGRAWLTGAIQQAALYDRALNDAEVLASFQTGGLSIPLQEVLAHLDPTQRAERDAALERATRLREMLDSPEFSAPLAYAGVRVQPPPTHLLKRGDVTSPGEVVTPAGLSAISALQADLGLPADAPEAERRLRFADWLVDPRNPLPARVMANRVWQFHFGQGLVSTPSDFGANGGRPSHPELLDWLAFKLVESGWSIKALHRLILASATYQQSSRFDAKAAAIDADDQLLWRFQPRRLEAEAVRDAMLAVSGEINLQVGGPSFRPFTTTDFNASFYHPFDRGDPEFNRRTVYRINVSSGKEPLLDALDCPDPSVKTPRRGVTTTPLQALGLMNGSFVQRLAQRLADRAMKSSGGELGDAIQRAYALTLGREATPEELRRASLAASERGFSSVCWALLNSTEFIYVN